MQKLRLVNYFILIPLLGGVIWGLGPQNVSAQTTSNRELDGKVRRFLDSRRGTWQNRNVPYADGKALFDLIIENQHTRALEIGTSTGHSAVWIAWALSKTGGRLITVEIDEDRRRTALANFEQAGVSQYIDARLADAHELVKQLEGPFDFVFSDADKDWYTQYFKDLDPKLTVGGCFTAHNVSNSFGGARDFVDYVMKQSNYETTINRNSRAGISISCKTAR